MSELLSQLFAMEKRRQLIYSVGAALLVAALILSGSFILSTFDPPKLDDNDGDGDDNPDPNLSYSLSLSSLLGDEFMEEGIIGFKIGGNITPAIHPRLINSEVIPDDMSDGWLVDAWVLDADTMDPMTPYQDQFVFSQQQMVTLHNTFLDSLNQTEEIDKVDIPDIGGSIPLLLFYEVYLANGSGYEFVWAGFDEVDIMIVSHFTFGGAITTTTDGVGLESVQVDDLSRGPVTEEHYISPLSAFDPFLDQLQGLYSSVLDV
ncbi:MAG: hypothetical protein ACXAE3_13075 [Candidatus Kariarchaeaceae archaeon]